MSVASHCIGDSGGTDDVTAHGTVSVTTTSGALTTNGDISCANLEIEKVLTTWLLLTLKR